MVILRTILGVPMIALTAAAMLATVGVTFGVAINPDWAKIVIETVPLPFLVFGAGWSIVGVLVQATKRVLPGWSRRRYTSTQD
jgi:hypothetical protein